MTERGISPVSYTHLAAAQAVASGQCEKGIVICTTGIGISITANQVKGIRCAPVSYTHLDVYKRQTESTCGAGTLTLTASPGVPP